MTPMANGVAPDDMVVDVEVVVDEQEKGEKMELSMMTYDANCEGREMIPDVGRARTEMSDGWRRLMEPGPRIVGGSRKKYRKPARKPKSSGGRG